MVLKSIALIAGLGMLAQVALPSACSQQQPAVNDVIAGVQTFCQFVPTATTIETIEKANPTITNITSIVGLICGAVTAQPAASASANSTVDKQVAVITVNGKSIPVVGHFVSN